MVNRRSKKGVLYGAATKLADQAGRRVLTSSEDVRQVIQEFTQTGLDEMVFLPPVPDLDQTGRLPEIVGS